MFRVAGLGVRGCVDLDHRLLLEGEFYLESSTGRRFWLRDSYRAANFTSSLLSLSEVASDLETAGQAIARSAT